MPFEKSCIFKQKYGVLFKIFFGIILFFSFNSSFCQDLDDLLKMDVEDLLKINVTSASKMPQHITETPSTVRLITARQIEERGYNTLEELLADLPGFQFRNIQGFNSYVFQRGIPNQNNLTLVLVDGIQVNELNSGGFYGGSQYNLTNVKQVEVVYGPASTLYGTNAFSGIVNIVTFDPKEIKNNQLTLLSGSFNSRAIDFKYGYNGEKVGFSFSGMFNTTEKENLKGEKGDFNWTENMENFEDNFSFDSKILYKNFKAGIVFQDKKASRSTNYKSIGSSVIDRDTNWHIRFSNIYMSYHSKFSSYLANETKIYFRDTTVMDDTVGQNIVNLGGDTGQVGYYRPNSSVNIESQFNYSPSEKLKIIAGLLLKREHLANEFSITYSGDNEINPPVPDKPKMLKNDLISEYFQVQFKFKKYFEMTFGLRHDDSNNYGNVNTPRFSIVFKKNKLFSKLIYMEAFRAPKPWDYTFGLGNENLDPEQIKSFEYSLGYKQSKYFLIDITYFDNQVDNIFYKETTDIGSFWVNNGILNVKGIEFSSEIKYKLFSSYFNYSYISSENEFKEQIPEIANHTGNLGVNYSFSNKFSINLRLNYMGNRENPVIIESTGDNIIHSVILTHCSLSFFPTEKITFQLFVKNVFDNVYYHSSNRPPDRYLQNGRSIVLKMGLKF